MTLLKPKHRRARPAPAWTTLPDGREICSPTAAGRREYRRRTLLMRDRQGQLCRWCGLWMSEDETTFDHDGRRNGRQDDRIFYKTSRGFRQINAAVHKLCNQERGSKIQLSRPHKYFKTR